MEVMYTYLEFLSNRKGKKKLSTLIKRYSVYFNQKGVQAFFSCFD